MRLLIFLAALALVLFHLALIFSGLVPNLVSRPLHLALALPWILLTGAQNPLMRATGLLLTLAALTVLGGQAESQVRLTVRHLLEAGATKQEIVECIGQMSIFAGIPAMTKVMELAQEVLAESEEDDT